MSGALSFLVALADNLPPLLTPRAAVVLLHLRSRASDGETDSFQNLLKVSGSSPPSLSRALDTLSQRGFVIRQERPKRSRNKLYISLTSDGYRIAEKIEAEFAAATALPPTHARRGKVAA